MYDDFERQGLMDRFHRKPATKKEKLSKPRFKKSNSTHLLQQTAVETPVSKSSPLQTIHGKSDEKDGKKRKREPQSKSNSEPKKKPSPKIKKVENSAKKTSKSVPARVIKARLPNGTSDEENSPIIKKRRVVIPPSSEDDRSPCKPKKQTVRKSATKRNSKTPKATKETNIEKKSTPKKKPPPKKKKEAKSAPPRRNLRETPERKNRRNSHDSFDSLFISDEDGPLNQTLMACPPSQIFDTKRLSFENYSPIRNVFDSSSDNDDDEYDDRGDDNIYNISTSTMRRSPKKFAQSVPAKLRKVMNISSSTLAIHER